VAKHLETVAEHVKTVQEVSAEAKVKEEAAHRAMLAKEAAAERTVSEHVKELEKVKQDAAAAKALEKEAAHQRWKMAMHEVAAQAARAKATAAAELAATETRLSTLTHETADQMKQISLRKAISARDASAKAFAMAAAREAKESAAKDSGARRLQGTFFTRKSSREFESKKRANRTVQNHARRYVASKASKAIRARREQSRQQMRKAVALMLVFASMAIAMAAGVMMAGTPAADSARIAVEEEPSSSAFMWNPSTSEPREKLRPRGWIWYGSAAPLLAARFWRQLSRAFLQLLARGAGAAAPMTAAAAPAVGGKLVRNLALGGAGATGLANAIVRKVATKAAAKATLSVAAPALGFSLAHLNVLIAPGIGSLLGLVVSAFL